MMNKRKVLSFTLALAIGLLVAGVVLAQTGNGYDLTWWTVDGGGGKVTGGGYTLMGTAGQPEPGPALSGGDYTLYSGFWPAGGEAPPACPTPLTDVSLSGPSSGETGEDLSFTASPQPSNATTPINYTWSTDGLVSGQGTSSATYNWASAGSKNVQVTARNCGEQDFSDNQTVDISPACTEVTNVGLTLVTSGVIYTDTEVTFSANVAPDGADKPYTYTIDYGTGASAPATSSDDPLELKHTFTATGTYDVEIAVWNCDMSEAGAVTGTAQVVISEQGVTCVEVTGVELSLATSGDIYTDTEVTLSANVLPDNAIKPYTYTIDYGAGASAPAISSDDPLELKHTFAATGTHDVEIAVWNCDMSEGQAVNDTVQVTVSEREEADHKIYLPLVVRNH